MATMGTSPAKAVETIRVNAARDLLEATNKSIKAIEVVLLFRTGLRLS
jgi:transcriptional regulator GlxA family with amidase domain